MDLSPLPFDCAIVSDLNRTTFLHYVIDCYIATFNDFVASLRVAPNASHRYLSKRMNASSLSGGVL